VNNSKMNDVCMLCSITRNVYKRSFRNVLKGDKLRFYKMDGGNCMKFVHLKCVQIISMGSEVLQI